MSGTLNKIWLIGRLVKDPELRYTGSGKAVCNARVATDFGYGDKKQTDYHNLVLWEQRGKVLAEYTKKGDPISVIGHLRYRDYEKDGIKRTYSEIYVDELILLGNKRDRQEQPKDYADKEVNGNQKEDDFYDSVPF